MVLNNYWELLKWSTKIDGEGYKYSDEVFRSMNGAWEYIALGTDYSVSGWIRLLFRYNACIFQYLGVMIGDGNTKPTADDYKLENDTTSNFTINQSYTSSVENGNSKVVFLISGTNKTDESQTISEIGVYKTVTRNINNSYSTYNLLIVRELLDEPIIVPPKKSFSLTFEWIQL